MPSYLEKGKLFLFKTLFCDENKSSVFFLEWTRQVLSKSLNEMHFHYFMNCVALLLVPLFSLIETPPARLLRYKHHL